MSNILEIQGLKVMYGKSVAIHDVNISVPQGGIVTLIGSNGAGKSTTLNTVLGLVPATAGKIMFNGEDITHASTAERVQKGLVLAPEGRHLFPYLTVQKNLLLGATQRKDKDGIQADLEFCFELFPILKDRLKQKAGTMSGGEQQMLAISRGLMSNPKLLMLDEPSLGLAPIIVEEIFNMIEKVRKAGTTVLLIEQNASIALQISDYAYAIELGRISLSGTGQELLNSEDVKRVYLGM